ncbi:hypothetical protein F4808DRAFT_145715 [Astrocystis sublimbata]|nr:hypothetical protein F4808DRAFT_145715 [Astrocystis sublimbata]
MNNPAAEYRCGQCKKAFKQKSSLVRHSKRCTLTPTPSLRQKSCQSVARCYYLTARQDMQRLIVGWCEYSHCVKAKARCDLKRPVCSRCEDRGVACVYSRPPRHSLTNSPPTSNSELVAPSPSINAGAVGAETLAVSDEDAYLHCGPDLAGFFVPADSADVSDTTPSSGSGFASTYSTSASTAGTHTAPCNSRHGDSSFGVESLNVQLDLDCSTEPTVLQEHLVDETRLLSNGVGSFATTGSTPESTAESASAPHAREIDEWIMALAARTTEQIDPPELVDHSVQTIIRVLRSWPRMLAKGIQLPPVIHCFQFLCDGKDPASGASGMPKHISRCVTLCKMWVGQAEDSEQIVQRAVRGEIESILGKYRTYDAPTLLAAMQSLLVLLIILLFPSNRQGTMSVVPGCIFSAIHEMANHVLSTGMLLHEEASHECPPWRMWAHVEAKRRTLVTIFFVHWAYSAYHRLTHFNCMELGRVLAPGPKWLWQARDEKTWLSLYGRFLAQWNGREMIQAEFFLVEKGLAMNPRVELWLEDADELGILMICILNATRRDPTVIRDAEAEIHVSRSQKP